MQDALWGPSETAVSDVPLPEVNAELGFTEVCILRPPLLALSVVRLCSRYAKCWSVPDRCQTSLCTHHLW